MSFQNDSPVAWYCKSVDLTVASVRIRGARVIQELNRRGVKSEWYSSARRDQYRCVVVSRRYDDASYAEVERLRDRGCRVVLDLCDNHFILTSSSEKHRAHLKNLRRLSACANAITVSAAPLRDIVAQECADAVPPEVIGDMADDLSLVPLPWYRRPQIALKARRETTFLDTLETRGVTRLIWFGNSGGKRQQSGIQDLMRVVPILGRLHREFPLHLTVISNNRSRFEQMIGEPGITFRYVEWDPWTFGSLLHRQEIALIPATPNSYTACKSDNRLVTAVNANVAVVADEVPSYRPYADAVQLGDLEQGLRTYLSEPAQRASAVVRARRVAQAVTDPEMLINRWRQALSV